MSSPIAAEGPESVLRNPIFTSVAACAVPHNGSATSPVMSVLFILPPKCALKARIIENQSRRRVGSTGPGVVAANSAMPGPAAGWLRTIL